MAGGVVEAGGVANGVVEDAGGVVVDPGSVDWPLLAGGVLGDVPVVAVPGRVVVA